MTGAMSSAMSGGATAGELVVDSVTGVDVALPVAGVGGRSFAFIIDWHIRTIVGIAWWFLGAQVADGPDVDGKWYVLGVLVPTAAIYFLYHPVLEVAMRGRTPGKRMAGLRIVTRHGGTPGVGALLVRNIFRVIDSLPAFYCVGLATTVFTAQHVRIGDLAAGTLLVYDRRGSRDSFDALPAALSSTLGPQLVELIDDLVSRWNELDIDARSTLARRLLDRVDPQGGYVPEGELLARLKATLQRSTL
jgi:uncharacterized RDD family membrane protein YckC